MVAELLKPLWGHRLVLRQSGEKAESILDDILLKTAAPAMPKDPPAEAARGGAKGVKDSNRGASQDLSGDGGDDY
jgi:hypothetical protein